MIGNFACSARWLRFNFLTSSRRMWVRRAPIEVFPIGRWWGALVRAALRVRHPRDNSRQSRDNLETISRQSRDNIAVHMNLGISYLVKREAFLLHLRDFVGFVCTAILSRDCLEVVSRLSRGCLELSRGCLTPRATKRPLTHTADASCGQIHRGCRQLSDRCRWLFPTR